MSHLVKIPFNQHVDMFISAVTDTTISYEKREVESGRLAEPPVTATYYCKDHRAYLGNSGNADSFIPEVHLQYAKQLLQ